MSARLVDLSRVRAALAELDRLVAAHPELRGECARLAALVDVAKHHHEGNLDAALAELAAEHEARVDLHVAALVLTPALPSNRQA